MYRIEGIGRMEAVYGGPRGQLVGMGSETI